MLRRSALSAYPWRGFEREPEGCLFDQLIDVEGEMGVAYERSLRFEKHEHVHDRPIFVAPRSGTSMRLTVRGVVGDLVVTSNDVAVVPLGLPHADHFRSEVYDTFALLPSASLVSRLATRVGHASPFRAPYVFPRSPWLDLLLGEYFTERVVRASADGPRHAPLEELLLLELLRLDRDASAPSVRPHAGRAPPGPSGMLARVLRHVEAHLFGDVDLEDLARVAAASRSSLIRQFRAELGTTPKAYVIGRRLDEARRLLERGGHDVGEVARLVGYESAGSFSEAFRRRFGESPSAVTRAAARAADTFADEFEPPADGPVAARGVDPGA